MRTWLGSSVSKKFTSIDAVGRRSAGTFDPQADKIHFLLAGLIVDQFLHLPDFVAGDRSF